MKVSFNDILLPNPQYPSKPRKINIEVNQSGLLLLPPSSGKTLLFEHIIGVRDKIPGEILINNIRVDLDLKSKFFELRKKMGILFEIPVLISNLTLHENLRLILKNASTSNGENHSQDRISTFLKRFRLEKFSGSRPSELTQSQKKVAAFIMAIIHKPELLIWDEPHFNFDEDIKLEVKKELNNLTSRNGLMLGISSSPTAFENINLENYTL